MKLDDFLRAHEFMRVERPPELWEINCEDDTAFVNVLGETIVVGLLHGNELADMVLNASNVTIDESAGSQNLRSGDYVALTVRGRGEWEDGRWYPGAEDVPGDLAKLREPFEVARVPHAYTRDLGAEGGSITVLAG
jgi:hypothetical protein